MCVISVCDSKHMFWVLEGACVMMICGLVGLVAGAASGTVVIFRLFALTGPFPYRLNWVRDGVV